jgi:hypothetical protein
VAVVLAASLLALVSAPVGAGPYDYGYTGGSDPVREPDNRSHSHCKTYFDVHHDWLNSTMAQLDSQTVMSKVDHGSCTSHTDVVWYKTALNGIDGGESVASTACVAHVSWGICEQSWVLVDQPLHFELALALGGGNPGGWYTANLLKTLLHEVGHTAGLHHATGPLSPTWGPMNTAFIPNGTPDWAAYLAYKPFQTGLIDANV